MSVCLNSTKLIGRSNKWKKSVKVEEKSKKNIKLFFLLSFTLKLNKASPYLYLNLQIDFRIIILCNKRSNIVPCKTSYSSYWNSH